MNRSLALISDRLMTRENAWTVGSFLVVIAGAAVGRTLLKSGWRSATGNEPPLNPDAEEANWVSALVWAVVTGALVGIVRTLSRKGASSVRRHWT